MTRISDMLTASLGRVKPRWLLVPALGTLVALILEPAWRLLFIGGFFVIVPLAVVLRDPVSLWMFLACACSGFNFVKNLGGVSAEEGLIAISAVDLPTLALAGALLLGSGHRESGPGSDVTKRRLLLLSSVLLFAWSVVSAVASARADVALAGTLTWLRVLAVMVTLAYSAQRADRVRWAVAGLLLALFSQSAIAAAQWFAGTSFGLYGHFTEESSVGMLTRSGGTLNPTVLSEYIGVLAPIALAFAFASRRRFTTALYLALFGTALGASFMTLTRAGLISMGISAMAIVLFFATYREIPPGRKLALLALVFGGAMLLAVLFSGSLLARLSEVALEMHGEAGRLPQMKQALRIIADNPLTGVGLGNYVARMGDWGPTLPYPVHNKLLLVTAELGLPGGLGYVALLVFALTVFVGQALKRDLVTAALYAGGAAAILGTLINMNTDVYSMGGAPELALFQLIGLGVGVASRDHR